MNPSSTELIRSVENRNRKYRVAFVVLMGLVLASLVFVVTLQYQALQKIEGQSAERARALKSLQEKTLETSGRTNSYIQCIARFFAEPNRADVTLTDLDKCNLERNGTAVPGVDNSPTTFLTVAPQEPDHSQPLTVTNQPSPVLGPVVPVTPTEPLPAIPKPVELLGIPVCIPFTKICVR